MQIMPRKHAVSLLDRGLPSIRAVSARLLAFRVRVWYSHGTRFTSKQTIASPQVSQSAKHGKHPLNFPVGHKWLVVIILPLSDRQLNIVLPDHSKESYWSEMDTFHVVKWRGAFANLFPRESIDDARVKDGTRGL
jgi:hypothetical protein